MQTTVIAAAAAVLATACHRPTMTPSVLAEATVGVAQPIAEEPSSTGGEIRLAGARGSPGQNQGTGVHVTFRRAGTTQELAFGLHRYQLWGDDGWPAAVFVRGGINLLEWDRVGGDDGLGLAGLSLQAGIGRNGKAGPCAVVTINRDFRWNDPDDTFVGVAIGLCRLAPTRLR